MCLVQVVLLFIHSHKTDKILQNSVVTENCKSFVGRRIQVCKLVTFERLTPCAGVSIISVMIDLQKCPGNSAGQKLPGYLLSQHLLLRNRTNCHLFTKIIAFTQDAWMSESCRAFTYIFISSNSST